MVFKFIYCCLLVIFGCSLVFAGTESLAEPLTLTEAVRKALEQNPSLNQGKEKISQLSSDLQFTRSALYPTLSISSSALEKKGAAQSSSVLFGGEPYNQYEVGLHLNQTLFRTGTFSAIGLSEKNREISKLDYEISLRDMTRNVIRTYYQIVLNSRTVDTLLQQQQIVKESLAVAQKRERIGRGQRLDVLQIKTQIALLDAQISTAKSQLAVAISGLATLMGETNQQILPAEFQIQDHLEAPELEEVKKNTNLMGFKIPELKKSTLTIEKIEDQKTISLGQDLPTLSFVGDYTYTNYKSSDLFNSLSTSWSFGLQLNIPLFSGFSSADQRKSLLSQKLQFEYEKKNLEDQLAYQQITSRKNLESAKKSISSGVDALKLAMASSEEAKRNYQLATIDFLQFLSIQQALVQAKQALNNYKFNYLDALTNYYASSGQDMTKLVSLLEGVNK